MDVYTARIKERTPVPTTRTRCWARKAPLCLLYIEFRDMDIIETNLHNLCDVYGGTGEAALVIAHSKENEARIKEITKDWENVRYVVPYEKNVDVNAYSALLCSHAFWDIFSEFTHVLINQWDSYLLKKIPEKFFTYDFVGAPCRHFYVIMNNQLVNVCHAECQCPRCLQSRDHPFTEDKFTDERQRIYMFNGGFSLRKVETMKQVCAQKKWHGEPEDVYFCITGITRPNRREACAFAIQDYIEGDEAPAGVHQLWVHQDVDKILSTL